MNQKRPGGLESLYHRSGGGARGEKRVPGPHGLNPVAVKSAMDRPVSSVTFT